FVTSEDASRAPGYRGPSAATKAALEALVRAWAQETASTKLRVNLFDPGPVRTRLRATVFPGEDPATLAPPEQVAESILPMCAPDWTETGKLYDYPSRRLKSFRAPECPRTLCISAHHPERPAPHLMRGGRRCPGKIMRIL